MTPARRAMLCVALLAGTTVAHLEVARAATSSATESRASRAAGSAPASVAPPWATWQEAVNSYRTQSGLAAVVEEPAWTAGMYQHILYLRSTPASLRTGQYASAHTENPASPFYTPAGAEAAGSSNIGSGTSARNAVDVWMSAPFHAIGVMRPSLAKSAFALDGTAMLDVLRGLGPPPNPLPTVLFPGPEATTYLTSFGTEFPDPREGCAADWKSFAGLPIFALLPNGQAPGPSDFDSGTTASLTRPDGTTIVAGNDLCVQTGASFNSSDPVYGPNGKAILVGANAVLVIPRAKLSVGRYTVNITVPAKASVTWSFTVVTTPAAPPVVSALWAGSGKIRVTWSAPGDGGAPITGFGIADDSGTSAPAAPGDRSVIVNIPVGTTHGSVSVLAANNVGPGPPTVVTWSRLRLPIFAKPDPDAGSIAAVVSGVGGDARAVLANLSMVDGVAPGYVTADRCSALVDGPQSMSSGNHGAGQAVANLAVVPVDELSTFCLYSQVPTHLVVDVQGSFSPSAPLSFTPVSPSRVLDTRTGDIPAAGSITRVDTGAPPGTQAVLVNLTMADAQVAGYITADTCAVLVPGQQTKSSGNHGVGEPIANLAVVPVAADGSFCIYSQQPTHLIVDLQGSFAPAGGLKFDPTVPTRVLDTRLTGTIPAADSIVRVETGMTNAAAVLVNLAMTDSPGAGYITADRCSTLASGPQTRSSGNHGALQAVSNLSVVPLDADGAFCIYTQFATQLVVDVQGSFSISGALGFAPTAPTRVLDTRMP
jgi:hypothetical protein